MRCCLEVDIHFAVAGVEDFNSKIGMAAVRPIVYAF